jgi:opacity protein-like surface antigen
MKQQIVSKLAVVIGATVISLSNLQAADPGPYAKLEPGVSFISGAKLKFSGTVNDAAGDLGLGALNEAGQSSTSVKCNAGFGINGLWGYRFNETIALEIEGGYQTNQIDTVGGFGTSGLDLHQWSGFANLVLGHKFAESLSGSIGAGLGGVNLSVDINELSNHFSNTAFAGQLKAGLTVDVAEAVSFVVGYRAQFVGGGDLLNVTANLPSGGNVAAKFSASQYINHQITAGITIGF